MIQQFLNHIGRHQLCKTSDKILLAVSGGLDSMVMLDVFLKAGFKPAVAHCNFQLRGNDSLLDEQLVKDTCLHHRITFHLERFETEKESAEAKTSVQVTARNLRYTFFDQLRQQEGYQILATAHHINDSLETVLLNLVRGTGIEGLTGIPVKNGWIVRPLLFASRQMLLEYALENEVRWREDVSNEKDDYHRNYLRHHVIPRLKDLNPSLEDTFQNTSERVNAMAALAQRSLETLRQEICSERNGKLYFAKAPLQQSGFAEVLLWELLKDYGFNYTQCKQLVGEHQPGSVFHANETTITVDRDHFIVEQVEAPSAGSVEIDSQRNVFILHDKKLLLETVKSEAFTLTGESSLAQLDLDRVQFPMTWRHWKQGDSFFPLGMNSRKKISDLLIDEKIPLPEKRAVTVLESNDEIIWVVGMRINDHYKVTDKTRNVLIIRCLHA